MLSKNVLQNGVVPILNTNFYYRTTNKNTNMNEL